MRIFIFRTNADPMKDQLRIAKVLNDNPQIIRWDLEHENGFTALSIMVTESDKEDLIERIRSSGFECEYWGG